MWPAIQLALTALCALGGGYLGVRISVTRLEGRVGSLEMEMVRLRKWHDDYGAALPTRVGNVEANIQGLRDWKHEKIDPYFPRAVDDLKERIDRMEDRQDK